MREQDAVVYNRHRNYAIFIRCSHSDFTRDNMPDEKKKHVTSFGKGRKRRRMQLRQAWAGQLATVAMAAPPVRPDSESDANDSNNIIIMVYFILWVINTD